VTDNVGEVLTRHDYYPFGEEIEPSIGRRMLVPGYGGMDGVRQKFTGYERDNETGLDFAQARYYGAVTGRFNSPDPIGGTTFDPQTWNKYPYVLNNPLKYTDPYGLFERPLRSDLKPNKKEKEPDENLPVIVKVKTTAKPINVSIGASIFAGIVRGLSGPFTAFRTAILGREVKEDRILRFAQEGNPVSGFAGELAGGAAAGGIVGLTQGSGQLVVLKIAQQTGITSAEGIARIASIRAAQNIGSGRNIAIADINLGGQAETLVGVSGQTTRAGTVEITGQRLFSTTTLGFPRGFDAEVKILETIGRGIKDPNVSGAVNLFTERAPCPSCGQVFDQFRARFPNVQLNVSSGLK
jgi:RHS repeat-associated protein